MFGSIVVGTDGSDTIGYYDFATQARGTVPQTADDSDSLSDISGDKIVFTRLVTSTSPIYSYQIGSGPR